MTSDDAQLSFGQWLRRRRRTLPGSWSGVLGRQYALAVVAEMLTRPEARLLTLIGPPGVGKTWLARPVGALLQYREAACFIELAPLQDVGTSCRRSPMLSS